MIRPFREIVDSSDRLRKVEKFRPPRAATRSKSFVHLFKGGAVEGAQPSSPSADGETPVGVSFCQAFSLRLFQQRKSGKEISSHSAAAQNEKFSPSSPSADGEISCGCASRKVFARLAAALGGAKGSPIRNHAGLMHPNRYPIISYHSPVSLSIGFDDICIHFLFFVHFYRCALPENYRGRIFVKLLTKSPRQYIILYEQVHLPDLTEKKEQKCPK